MKRVGLAYDEVFLKHNTPKFHPESKERLISIINAINRSDIKNKLHWIKPRKATPQEIEYVHAPDYVRMMSHFTGYADPDTFLSEESYEAALYAAGAVLESIELIKKGEVDRSFCAVRPPGHHAEANQAMGFCIFNNIAIGARGAQKLGYKKVFIIDFDVHHGNGTEHAFYSDPDVFYFSTHQSPLYPGTGLASEIGSGKGEGTTYNSPMRPGSGNKEYLEVYQDILPRLVDKFSPDIVLVSAGYDLYAGDELAAIKVSKEGIDGIVKAIISASKGLPIVFALEGGYNIDDLGELVVLTLNDLLYSQ